MSIEDEILEKITLGQSYLDKNQINQAVDCWQLAIDLANNDISLLSMNAQQCILMCCLNIGFYHIVFVPVVL